MARTHSSSAARPADLVVIFSGGTISFASGTQLVSTIGACGLMPLLVGLVNG